MNKEDKKIQEDLVNEMMKVSKTNPDVMIYMQSLMKCYEELEKEANQLQSNWNSLRDWVFEHIDSVEFNSYDDVLDKMNELEGVDNENNRLS